MPLQAGEALAELAYIAAQYDGDGIEIQFLNSPIVKHGLKVSISHTVSISADFVYISF